MVQEDKDLLLRDLCARLPYRVRAHYDMNADPYWDGDSSTDTYLDNNPTGDDNLRGFSCGYFKLDCADGIRAECIKPYLRSMSSMTKEEKKKFIDTIQGDDKSILDETIRLIDFFNSIHIDYRGLIEKGLALEAKKGMYK